MVDFICYDRWPGPASQGIDFSDLRGLQIHVNEPTSPGNQMMLNYIQGAIDRGVIVSPRSMIYDHKVT